VRNERTGGEGGGSFGGGGTGGSGGSSSGASSSRPVQNEDPGAPAYSNTDEEPF
jgi:hypothetical protein